MRRGRIYGAGPGKGSRMATAGARRASELGVGERAWQLAVRGGGVRGRRGWMEPLPACVSGTGSVGWVRLQQVGWATGAVSTQ
jgi:hypothetical protein